mmetsp:Transcript_27124/g.81354  ORF Transcript_27124/g.81354 Transcript_27124/m.81354 type:complete len:87 (+) Transcript_27124:311-571(+)
MEADEPAEQPTLNPNLVEKLLQTAAAERGDDRLKLSQGAVRTLGELLRLFILEARSRAEAEARADGDDEIKPDHIEAALAELLADF